MFIKLNRALFATKYPALSVLLLGLIVQNGLIKETESISWKGLFQATNTRQHDVTDAEWGQENHTYGKSPKKLQLPEGDQNEEFVEIAVLGGGIAGLALAAGLAQNGFSFKVYERANQLRSSSQGMLSLRPCGLKALESIHPDILQSVKDGGSHLENVVMTTIGTDGSTQIIKVPDFDLSTIKRYGSLPVLISWAELQKALARFVPHDCIRGGCSLRYFEECEETDTVLLTFENGLKVRCRALIGCDGTFSVVRKQLYPDDCPISFKQLNWNSIANTNNFKEKPHAPNTVTHFNHKDNNGSIQWTGFLNDCGSGNTFWQIRIMDHNSSLALSKSGGRGGLGLRGIKSPLLKIVEDVPDLKQVLSQTPESNIFERSIIGRTTVSGPWQSAGGRVTLMGDSAHAMHPLPGLGANTALEGAKVFMDTLLRCKKSGKLDWKTILNKYEFRFRRRAEALQIYSNYAGGLGVPKTVDKKYIQQMLTWCYLPLSDKPPPPEVMDSLDEENIHDPDCTSPI